MTNKLFLLFSALILVFSFFVRTYQLDKTPPALYWEEVALGYDAFSIATNLKDHHDNFLPIVAFESFGDYKPSLYFYSTAFFVKLFGLNLFSVKATSIISGLFIVLGCGFLTAIIAKSINLDQKDQKIVTLIGMLIGAIAINGILLSRVAFETNLASALILWAVLFGLKAYVSKNHHNLILQILSVILLSLSIYAYHAARIVAPLLGFGLVLIWTYQAKINIKLLQSLFILGLLSIILISPILLEFNSKSVGTRFSQTSIFSNLDPILQSNQSQDLTNHTWLSKVIFHRYYFYSITLIENYLKNIDLNYLFIHGDINPRHSVQKLGQFYHLEIITILLGLYFLWQKKNRQILFLFYWLLIGIIPSAVTVDAPHALRTASIYPVFLIIAAFGTYQLVILFRRWPIVQRATLFLLAIGYILEFLLFWQTYLYLYPLSTSQHWMTGYAQIIPSLNQAMDKNPDLPVFFSREMGRPAMYYWFYSKTNPSFVQNENYQPQDQGEYLKYDRITFFSNSDEVKLPAIVTGSIDTINQISQNYEVISRVSRPNITDWYTVIIK